MTVYSSPYSTIVLDKEKKLLEATWLKEAKQLGEEDVIEEISHVLKHVMLHSITYVLIDARNYPFRHNDTIQRWINNEFIPEIMENGVKRYAILVENRVESQLDNLADLILEEVEMKMNYFTNRTQALDWLANRN